MAATHQLTAFVDEAVDRIMLKLTEELPPKASTKVLRSNVRNICSILVEKAIADPSYKEMLQAQAQREAADKIQAVEMNADQRIRAAENAKALAEREAFEDTQVAQAVRTIAGLFHTPARDEE